MILLYHAHASGNPSITPDFVKASCTRDPIKRIKTPTALIAVVKSIRKLTNQVQHCMQHSLLSPEVTRRRDLMSAKLRRWLCTQPRHPSTQLTHGDKYIAISKDGQRRVLHQLGLGAGILLRDRPSACEYRRQQRHGGQVRDEAL